MNQTHHFIPVRKNVDIHLLQEQASSGSRATIVLVPGFHSDLHEWGDLDDLSQSLIKEQFQVFRFSFSGSGLSRGEVYNITLSRQIDELHKVLEFIHSIINTQNQSVGILGKSFGATTLMAAAPISANSLIFTSGAYDPVQTMPKVFSQETSGIYNPLGDSWFDEKFDSVRIGPQFWEDLKHHNFDNFFSSQDKPTLLIHGKKDFIEYQRAKKVFDKIKAPKKLTLIKNAGHNFEGKDKIRWIQNVIDWFNDTLPSR